MASHEAVGEKPAESLPLRATKDSPSFDRHTSNELTNASGHKQELGRNFSLLNICGIAATTGNSWTAIGGSVVRSPSYSDRLSVSKEHDETNYRPFYRLLLSTMEDPLVSYMSCECSHARCQSNIDF